MEQLELELWAEEHVPYMKQLGKDGLRPVWDRIVRAARGQVVRFESLTSAETVFRYPV